MIKGRNGFGNDSHTVLYITADETTSKDSFIDSSKQSQTVNYTGITQEEISHPDYGSLVWSWPNTDTTDKGMVCPSNDFLYGELDYSIDLFIYYTAYAAGYSHLFTQYRDSNNYMQINQWIGSTPSANIQWQWKIYGNGGVIIDFSIKLEGISLNTWYHFSFVRRTRSVGESYDIYTNGNWLTGTTRESIYDFQISDEVNIGRPTNVITENLKNAYIDNFRISKGNKRWQRGYIYPNRSY